jgi:cytoskeleton protein RodZ
MGSFGENLRREREMRGISLEEIAESTKISVRFLHAMENDDFANLPGGIFTRSFIRSYAKYLGLDEEQVMSEFQMTGQSKELELSRLMFASSSNSSHQERKSWLLPVLLAGVMLAGGYSLFRYAHRHEDIPMITGGSGQSDAQPLPQSADTGGSTAQSGTKGASRIPAQSTFPLSSHPAANDPSPNQPPSGAPQAPAGTAGSAITGTIGKAADSEMVLRLAATERVWVSVDADGRTALQRTLNPQDVSTIKAKDHFDVMTGNAQALILTLNGATLKPLGHQGEVKKVHLTHSDVKSPTP